MFWTVYSRRVVRIFECLDFRSYQSSTTRLISSVTWVSLAVSTVILVGPPFSLGFVKFLALWLNKLWCSCRSCWSYIVLVPSLLLGLSDVSVYYLNRSSWFDQLSGFHRFSWFVSKSLELWLNRFSWSDQLSWFHWFSWVFTESLGLWLNQFSWVWSIIVGVIDLFGFFFIKSIGLWLNRFSWSDQLSRVSSILVGLSDLSVYGWIDSLGLINCLGLSNLSVYALWFRFHLLCWLRFDL
jgi:hypothetical protein